MQVQARTKYARMSPKKVIEVARTIRGKNANAALELLKFIPRKSALLISKTLQSAIANAENNHDLSGDSLTVELATVEQGPALKRFKAAARGGVAKRKKRMSHIRIVLSDNA
ncbi:MULTISPECIES: 50S ribosomal protein L22 [unclassified Pelagicoccus]|uniref:50S ribosomal protein L22 n=1 Tax=unclassified Pelagicoccus TaxID=2773306 RepID=UPI00280F4400|nr:MULTISPECIES: 50S ribosomal protein L22 [unclassified Pelagicoccus]MDQ8183052.1 50S ribosomal protein L22 [Pelagicoccus sp. SDUM812005]MDQ8187222.1 50S ribosomal protein L22 [Pelagicoccus sp. SDUM812002]